MTRYCAKAEPEVFSRGAISLSVFFTLEFLVHRRWGRRATALKRGPTQGVS